MLKWLISLSPFQFAFIVGCGGALGAFIGVSLINWLNPHEFHSYWGMIGGFIGGFLSGLWTGKRNEQNKK